MNDRYKKTNLASILGIVSNIGLLILKILAASITKSQAMLSDAFNSAGDIYSSLMTFIGNIISQKKPDDTHNLGHGKAEYVFSLLISITIIFVSCRLLYSSVCSFFLRDNFKFSKCLIVVSLITIIVKFLLYLYTSKIAKKYNNILMHANSQDHFADCFIGVSTLISSIFAKYNYYIFDGIIGCGISMWILYQGINLFKKSYDVLMDRSLSDDVKEKVLSIINKYPEIKKINHFNSTPVGYQFQISLTIFVDGNLTTFESHTIANKLEKEIVKLDEIYLVVIHVNPI